MESTLEDRERENIACGKVFLSLDHYSSQSKILINCLFCQNFYDGFQEYTNHLLMEHYPQVELEYRLKDKNYQNIKREEDLLQRKDDNRSDNDFIFRMDSQNFYTDGHNISDSEYLFQETQNESCMPIENLNHKINRNKKCSYCNREFFLTSSLENHLKRHQKTGNSIGGNYRCKTCKSEFDLKFSLTMHKCNEYKITKQNCLKTLQISNSKNTKRHEIQQKKAKVLDTNNISYSEEALSANIDNISDDLSEQDDAVHHANSNVAVETEEFHCTMCSKKFCGQSRFNAHMNRHKPCEFKCTTCLKEFKTAGELQTHTRFHTGERPYLCSSCGETFVTVSKLINHTRRHHTFERTKQCKICKKKFFASGELKVHLQSTHSNERPYKCNLCPSTFNRPFSLRTHMKSHENKREYKCNLCPASFNQKCNLTAHKKKSHCLLTDDDKRT